MFFAGFLVFRVEVYSEQGGFVQGYFKWQPFFRDISYFIGLTSPIDWITH